MLPALSLQVAFNVSVPSPDEVEEVVQLAESMPDPSALSVQFQFTVTSVLFQPAPLAAEDWVGAAVGGIESSGVQELAPAGDVSPAGQAVCAVAPGLAT